MIRGRSDAGAGEAGGGAGGHVQRAGSGKHTLWQRAFFSFFAHLDAEFRWVDMVVQRLVFLDKPCVLQFCPTVPAASVLSVVQR